MQVSEAARRAVAELPGRYGQPAVELTASGTAAIEVALEVLGIGPGDEVVVPDLGCHLVGAAVLRRAAVPVFVGVGDGLTLRPEDVLSALAPATRAVIAVHQYGLPCDVAAIVAAVPAEIAVIEDVAQTWGSHVAGVPSGATGALTVTSFGPGKPLSLGAGGALLGPPSTVVGSVSHGDGREGMLTRPPSSARFPLPLLESLPAALDRADARLAARRSLVAAFLASDAAADWCLPPLPPGGEASWTTVPLYPMVGLTAGRLRAVRDLLGPVEVMPRVPPSGLPMFRDPSKRIVPGPHRRDPLLVTPNPSI